MDRIRLYSLDLLAQVESGRVSTRKELGEEKFRLCSKYGLSGMPSNATILSFAGEKSDVVIRLLKVKPTRSLSGISVVAIMSRPHDCPGRCIYCPGSLLPGVDTPKSYTGREPATMRAVSFGFSPRRQVFNRLKQLEEAGHSIDKLELIVMGGTFLSHPAGYQRTFMLSAINALAGSREKTLAGAKKAAEKAVRYLLNNGWKKTYIKKLK